ncbi:MAG: hypothetical protein Q7R90_03950 [bacterium]|nr:hypothetical protein [bacterium]
MNTEKISLAAGGTLIASAVVFDIIQFLLVLPWIGLLVNSIISIFAAMFFGMSFSHYDMSIMSPERFLGFGGTMVGEVIPGVDIIPFWTVFVARTVIHEWRSPRGI